MSLDSYRARMLAAHDHFAQAIRSVLDAYGEVQTVFTDLLEDVDSQLKGLDTQLSDLRESNDELKRLILEQGTEIRALRAQLGGQP